VLRFELLNEHFLNYQQSLPVDAQGMLHPKAIIRWSGLEPTLYELLKIRVSELNSCSDCIAGRMTSLFNAGDSSSLS
jgi:AhpD family alkylhydroperoxidase